MSPAPEKHSRWLLGAGLGLIVGSLTPWASFLGFASASGLQIRFGWITLLAGTVTVTIAANPRWLKRQRWLAAHRPEVLLTAGWLSVSDCWLVILGASHSQYGPAIAAQWGVFLTLIVAIAVCGLARGEKTR